MLDVADRIVQAYGFPQGNALKRAGEALESHRPSPRDSLHRRVVSNNGARIESPEMSQFGSLPNQYSTNPSFARE